MDPASTIGLASGILTFLQAALKLTKVAYEIHSSLDGVLDDNRHTESLTDRVKEVVERLDTGNSGLVTEQQKSLHFLAKKCQVLSAELINVLNDIKPKRKSSTLLKAWKATRAIDRIRNLERRLGDCRGQLTMALVELARSEATNNFRDLLSLGQKNAIRLEALTKALENLRHGEITDKITDIGSQASNQLRQLLNIDKEALRVITQQRILENLELRGISSRYDAVHEAHEDTFKWIYEPVDMVTDHCRYIEAHKAQQETRERFVGWLSSPLSESPIFHISGKLGSGKSTLMKFLYRHDRTQAELQKWAGSKSLVFANFFFWRHGLPHLRTISGLCCSLLHDVLKKRPDLIADILPECWKQAQLAPWHMQEKLIISKDVIKSALERLLNNERIFDSHRFCFFIDGLDEFEPGVDSGLDYIDLVRTLRLWTVRATGNLKLCVSSREDPVFMTEYDQDPGFRLQYLTRLDMQNYVRDRLTDMKNPELRDEFVHEIPDRSSGVFLWTYLVVTTIRNKLSHEASDAVLKEQLNSLPRGVQALFEHVLNNLESKDQVKTLRTTSLLPIADSCIGLSLLAFSFMDDYERDPMFSIRNNLTNDKPDEKALQKRLHGICGGLIECHYDNSNSSNWLAFVHRSVPDMFRTNAQVPELSSRMDDALDEWDVVDAYSHLCFAAIRVSDMEEISVKCDCRRIIRMRLTEKVDQSPYRFLEYLSTWIDNKWPIIPQPASESHLERHSECVSILINIRGLFIGPECTGPISLKLFLCTASMAAEEGLEEFFEWKTRNNQDLSRDPLRRPLIALAVLESWRWYYFFRYPLISIHHKSDLIPDPFRATGPHPTRFSAKSDPLAIWQIYVARFLLSERESYPWTWPVLERFLEQGLDLYCEIQVETDGDAAVCLSICFPEAKIYYREEEPNYDGVEILLLRNVVGYYQRCRGKTRLEWGQSFNEVVSFRELIASSEFKGRSRLLELLDHNDKRSMNSQTKTDHQPISGFRGVVGIFCVLCLLVSIRFV